MWPLRDYRGPYTCPLMTTPQQHPRPHHMSLQMANLEEGMPAPYIPPNKNTLYVKPPGTHTP